MQIGEFAKLCNTKISVLRHYDKEGLLEPDYVDIFTGYRYYSIEQIPIFNRISALKKAGFSLVEIKKILKSLQDDEQLLELFQNKKRELMQTVLDLEEAKKMILCEGITMRVNYIEQNNRLYAKSEFFDANLQNEKREEMEKNILGGGYQRLSQYMTMGEQMSNQVYLMCEVTKLSECTVDLNEDTNIEFEDDPSVVGKWQTVGEYAVKEDFYGNVCGNDFTAKEIYFLPGGCRYWCYAWSRGKLICTFGDSASVNDYTLEEFDGKRYMFVSLKSYEYRHGGKPSVLILRQIDNISYSPSDIAKKDNIDMPFVDDCAVIGKWKVKGFCRSSEDFDTTKTYRENFFKHIEFKSEGEVISVYGERINRGRNMQTWTKGYVLCKWDNTACAYQIRILDGKEYLFIEWKSGDYIYGNLEPHYYVFERESDIK